MKYEASLRAQTCISLMSQMHRWMYSGKERLLNCLKGKKHKIGIYVSFHFVFICFRHLSGRKRGVSIGI